MLDTVALPGKRLCKKVIDRNYDILILILIAKVKTIKQQTEPNRTVNTKG